MLLPIKDIIITNRKRNDLGDITNLANSMKQFGLLAPVVVNESHHLIAGERRIRAAELLGWNEIGVTMMTTSSAEDALLMEISENVDRKSFTREEQVNAGIELERIESIRAEERQKYMLKQNSTAKENFPERNEFGQVRDIVAKYFGMSGKQYERDKYVVAHKELFPLADKDGEDIDYNDWNNFKVSTNKVYLIIRKLLDQQTSKSAGKKNTATTKPTTVEKIVEIVPDDYETIKTEVQTLRTDIAAKNQRITELENRSTNNNEELTATIAERDRRIEELESNISTLESNISTLESSISTLESDISTFNNAAFLERNSSNVYRALDGTDDIYELAHKIRQMLEDDLAPLKFRRCFERIPVSATARENLQTMVDGIRSWCFEMDGILSSNNPNNSTVVIDY